MSSIDRVRVRVAASSIASGSPSSERHRSWTLSSTSGPLRRRCAAARRLKSSTASACSSGPSSRIISPATPSGTWLVHSTSIPAPASSKRVASSAASSTTCSQLSRTTKALLCRSRSKSAASPGTLSAATTASVTSFAFVAVSSLANHTPPVRDTVRAAAIASAVFPTPPRPVTSTNLLVASRSDSAASSVPRPTRSSAIVGRLPGFEARERGRRARRRAPRSVARAVAAADPAPDPARRPSVPARVGRPQGHRLGDLGGTTR